VRPLPFAGVSTFLVNYPPAWKLAGFPRSQTTFPFPPLEIRGIDRLDALNLLFILSACPFFSVFSSRRSSHVPNSRCLSARCVIGRIQRRFPCTRPRGSFPFFFPSPGVIDCLGFHSFPTINEFRIFPPSWKQAYCFLPPGFPGALSFKLVEVWTGATPLFFVETVRFPPNV